MTSSQTGVVENLRSEIDSSRSDVVWDRLMDGENGSSLDGPHRNPIPTVDIIIEMADGSIVLIRRKNPPLGWALPGGFVDYGESLETAAAREAKEETSLEVRELRQFHAYSDPARDTRMHTISTVFIAKGVGNPIAADDAADIGTFRRGELPSPLCFDHDKILDDYFRNRDTRGKG